MIRKILKSALYLISLACFSMSSYANDARLYIPYKNLLLDSSGKVIVNNEGDGNSITYRDHYWIIQKSNDVFFNNFNQVNNFEYSFDKQGDILTFKPGGSLTYLGNERIAYYYQDTEVSVLIDTDGHLITPKGVYYKKINPFNNGYAEVKTQDNKRGYIDLQGQFVSKNPNELNTKYNPHCQDATLDKIMQLCDKHNSKYLINKKTGKEVDIGKRAWEMNSYHFDNNVDLSGQYFWVQNYQDNYMVYQLYDYEGTMLYENSFYQVAPFYGSVSWVKKDSNEDKYRLINATGETLDKYDNYSTVQVGDHVLFYAKTKLPEKGYKDGGFLTKILDQDGHVLFYEDKIDETQNSACKQDLIVLKDTQDNIVWPLDIEKECLLNRYVDESVVIDTWMDKKYKVVDIPKDKIGEIANYFVTKKQNDKNTNTINHTKNETYLAGPETVNIKDIADLTIPNGYIYYEWPSLEKNCNRFLMPAYSNNNQLCISVHNVGYIDLKAEKKQFDNPERLQEIKNNLQRKVINYRNRYQHFEWLIEPQLDVENHTMKFGYRYFFERIRENNRQEVITGQIIAQVIFVKDHMIVLTTPPNNMLANSALMEFDWAKQIKVRPEYQFDKQPVYRCSQFALTDSALSTANFDYLNKGRCFPISLTELIDETEQQNDSEELTNLQNALFFEPFYYHSDTGIGR
ncbi:WG repeat-containing protein [Gilliamella sp. Pas-s95]|uniref:WG repeat-containing protein n=1 Tax=Gilliamella sp. Pas-s95 TaxID=2687317 RepID=UPI0013663708|nr:WG repeat-containing protein [Gilliamella sp. Pas-s95]